MAGAAFWSSSAAESPLYSTDPWDVVYFNEKPLPGVCEVRGIAQLDIDNKKGKGRDGSTITVTGYQPGPFEITCEVYTKAQWDVLQQRIDEFWTKPNKKKLDRVALTVRHPALAAIHISSAAMQAISFPEKGSIEGSKMIRFKMLESVASGKKLQTKTDKDDTTVHPKLANDAPKNATPPRPSSDPAKLGPAGQPAPPASGSS